MNDLGIAILKSFEGCRLKAYRDDAGVWTIGYGDTGADVVEGLEISQEEAEQRLQSRLQREFIPGVEKILKVDLTDDQKSALVVFSYNEGLGKLKSSTLLAKVNSGNLSVKDEFAKWKFAGGHVDAGLVTRRKAEAALFAGDHDAVQAILDERAA